MSTHRQHHLQLLRADAFLFGFLLIVDHLLELQVRLFVLVIELFSFARQGGLQLLDLHDGLVDLVQADDEMLTCFFDFRSFLGGDFDLNQRCSAMRNSAHDADLRSVE